MSDDEEADEAKEEGIEEVDEDHHDRLPQKMIIFTLSTGRNIAKLVNTQWKLKRMQKESNGKNQ